MASYLALRIGTSLSTVRRLEDGHPGTALHTFLRALHVLGRLEAAVGALALERDVLGMALVREQLPRRVRSSASKSGKRRFATAQESEPGVPGADTLEGF